jgi:hypothetical protein
MPYRRVVSILLLAAYVPACAHYQETAQPLAELTAPPAPVPQARVTLSSGSRVQVTNPRVDGDTLRGTEGLMRTSGPPVAIPLAAITKVEVVPPSTMSGGTRVAVAAAAVGLVALAVIWAEKLGDCGWMCD